MQHGACWQRTLRMSRHSQTTHSPGIQAAMSMSAFNHIDIFQSLNGIPRVRDFCEFDGTTTTVRQRLIGHLLWPCIGIGLRGIGTQSLAERIFRNGCNLNRGRHYVSLASWSCNCDECVLIELLICQSLIIGGCFTAALNSLESAGCVVVTVRLSDF